jgi:hypothetical protein
MDDDDDIDQEDVDAFIGCMSGDGVEPDPACGYCGAD